MPRSRYAEIVPDPDVRTALSGMLGRLFWTIASDEIWERMQAQNDAHVERLRTALCGVVRLPMCWCPRGRLPGSHSTACQQAQITLKEETP